MQESITYSSTHEFYLAICLLLPLVSFATSFVISDRYSWAISFTAPFFQLLSACCAVVLFIRFDGGIYVIDIPWFEIGTHHFTANLEINPLSSIMLPVVSIISFLVHLYSTAYMAGNAGNRRFFGTLSFFTFAMLGIILANDLLLLFIFWELLGFSSYMLIGHWMELPKAGAAAKKAFIMNRIGDAGFLVGLMVIWVACGTFDLAEILRIEGNYSWKIVATMGIFLGVMGKSAQFPFFNWLPDAMVGPTPVSALIHAATMVVAGVFLMARIFPLLPMETLTVVAAVGATTAVVGALSALGQTDIKKILAYSTISQLGIMTASIGIGAPEAAMLHLVTHAFFKACLFLSAGAIIHVLHQAQQQSHDHFDVQDINNLGGLRKKMPFTCAAFVISGASLSGIPLLSGFLSKDAILTASWFWATDENAQPWHWTIVAALWITSFVTVIYTFRLIWTVFMNEETKTKNLSFAEAPSMMRIPLAVTMLASTWLILSGNPLDFMGWLFNRLNTVPYEHVAWIVVASVMWVSLALTVAFFTRKKSGHVTPSALLHEGFFLDAFYNLISRKLIFPASALVARVDLRWIDGMIHTMSYVAVTFAHLIGWFDRNIVDGAVHLTAASARSVGTITRSIQGGKIQLYIFWATLGLIIFIIWMLV